MAVSMILTTLARNVKLRNICGCILAVLLLWTCYNSYTPRKQVVKILRKGYTDAEEYPGDCSEMDDLKVVNDLRKNLIISPISRDVPYNLLYPEDYDPSIGQAGIIKHILDGQRNGFFIECGAYDGESGSNTLMLERWYNWTGLLIEADPTTFKKLVKTQRKAYLSPTCLSPKCHPEKVSFLREDVAGHIVRDKNEDYHDRERPEVQCFPLYTYLLALNRTTIDYFSLDVEGFELDVLRNIPWHKVNIRTLSVEWNLVRQGKEAIRTYMESVGYYVHSDISIGKSLAWDYIFVKRT